VISECDDREGASRPLIFVLDAQDVACGTRSVAGRFFADEGRIVDENANQSVENAGCIEVMRARRDVRGEEWRDVRR
jgi:hypothetical protein